MPDTTIANISEVEKSQKLQVYDTLQEKKLSSEDAVDDFVENAKCSLLFQYSWDESLSAAPLSINLIGSCYIACSVDAATAVTLPTPVTGSYKYLQYVIAN